MSVAPLHVMSELGREPVSYILPIKSEAPNTSPELRDYIAWIAARAEAIVVDGSEPAIFAAHEREWGAGVRHVAPAPDLISPMGKVGGVLTGLRLASHEHVIIADDDVRYDEQSLAQTIAALATADVVRPQNYFEPLPWHARWDSGRMLLNRLTGGDWPGTLGVRRSRLQATNGYDGSVMFENLELVRTVLASGGRERVLYGAYVLRRPSTAMHFWSQRVRQAYDEIARPSRMIFQLVVLPLALWL
ncbi:MAG TPA: glycosyltransferase family 2 protein, partial [Gemmatimonadaceae bacterium]